MKLSRKLPLVFTLALLLLFAAALFGLGRLNSALTTYQTTVAVHTQQERVAADTLGDFRVQVQEWKNVLLRGKDDAQLSRYWAAFEKSEGAVQAQARKLLGDLPTSDARERVGQFLQAHERMGWPTARGSRRSRPPGGMPPQATRPCRAWTGSRRNCWSRRAI